MLNLIEDLVNISKIESGEIVIRETEFQLDQFVNDIVEPFQLKADKKNIKLLRKYSLNEIENYIISDQTMLEKILKNLLNNALNSQKRAK